MNNDLVYEMVVKQLLEALEKGEVPWHKPWIGVQEAVNYVTRKPYVGINCLLLPRPGEYLSFKQCSNLGGKVKKGEKSHLVIYSNSIVTRETKDLPEEEQKKIWFFKYYRVFHVDQCEGIESKTKIPETLTWNEEEKSEKLITSYVQREGINYQIVLNSNKAFYRPLDDSIVLPGKEQFKTSNGFYGTAFHELSHSTGAEKRLNRKFGDHFGDEKYSYEELIAEISSAMLMNKMGIEGEFDNSVAYIRGWSQFFKENKKKMIVQAANAARKAADFILGNLEEETTEE